MRSPFYDEEGTRIDIRKMGSDCRAKWVKLENGNRGEVKIEKITPERIREKRFVLVGR